MINAYETAIIKCLKIWQKSFTKCYHFSNHGCSEVHTFWGEIFHTTLYHIFSKCLHHYGILLNGCSKLSYKYNILLVFSQFHSYSCWVMLCPF